MRTGIRASTEVQCARETDYLRLRLSELWRRATTWSRPAKRAIRGRRGSFRRETADHRNGRTEVRGNDTCLISRRVGSASPCSLVPGVRVCRSSQRQVAKKRRSGSKCRGLVLFRAITKLRLAPPATSRTKHQTHQQPSHYRNPSKNAVSCKSVRFHQLESIITVGCKTEKQAQFGRVFAVRTSRQ